MNPQRHNLWTWWRWPGLMLLACFWAASAGRAWGDAASHGPQFVDAGRQVVIPADRQARTIGLLGDVGFEQPRPGGLVWDSISIAQSSVTFGLRPVHAPPTVPPVARITLRHRDAAQPGDRMGREFALQWQPDHPPAHVAAELQLATASILRRDQGGYFQVVGEPSPWPLILAVVAGLLAWLAGWLVWLTRTRNWQSVQVRFKPTHLLPALLQSILYTYWAHHVAEVATQLPRIAAQIILAYLLDFLLGMTLRRRWDATFGPIPIVLSTNLFVWFPPTAFHLSLLVIAFAVGSKWLVQRRAGGHVFNPSAFGISVVAVVCLSMPELARFQDIAHLFSEPPHMLALVAGLAIVAQVRVPIVLMTLAATGVLLGLKALHVYHTVYPFWPAILLGLALLATDPATIPRTGLGRMLSGLSLGLLVWAVSAGLTWLGESDFYGKVLPIPLLNWLAPQFDKLAGQLRTWALRWPGRLPRLPDVFEPRYNWAHLGLWLLLVSRYVWST